MAQDFLLPSFLMLENNIQSPLQASAPHTVRVTHLADVGRLQNCRFLLPSFLMLENNIQSPLQASAPHTVRVTHLADVGRLQNCRIRLN